MLKETLEELAKSYPSSPRRWVNCYQSTSGDRHECFYCKEILIFPVGTVFFSHCRDYATEEEARRAAAANEAENRSHASSFDTYLGPMPKL